MTSDDVRRLADFLAAVTEATTKYGVEIGAYGPADIRINDDEVMQMRWDAERSQYDATPQSA
ncbi:hypothetical protein OOK41_09135 [Micromonospora sp. NBC_01655]|uniref:hypothetical protein n=1 Tax=Micromonospora sp. NBC_01655 TaxID=2975983 RepID=UPI0022573225|nr:hypothetical protein [Micromonospora sp. NBC_01655]MCX4470469.1 hypothetical protein [Micromonospora sp. NBC_01655]